MMNYSLTASLGVFSAVGGWSAVEVGEKPEIPQLRDSKDVVHDGTRPQAVKVKTAGAVAVQAPQDENGKNVAPASLTVLHHGVVRQHRKAYLGPTDREGWGLSCQSGGLMPFSSTFRTIL